MFGQRYYGERQAEAGVACPRLTRPQCGRIEAWVQASPVGGKAWTPYEFAAAQEWMASKRCKVVQFRTPELVRPVRE